MEFFFIQRLVANRAVQLRLSNKQEPSWHSENAIIEREEAIVSDTMNEYVPGTQLQQDDTTTSIVSQESEEYYVLVLCYKTKP